MANTNNIFRHLNIVYCNKYSFLKFFIVDVPSNVSTCQLLTIAGRQFLLYKYVLK